MLEFGVQYGNVLDYDWAKSVKPYTVENTEVMCGVTTTYTVTHRW